MLHYDFQEKKLICTDTELLSFAYEVYRGQRYLIKVSNEKLFERLEHLLINLIELDFNGGKKLNIKNGKLSSAIIDVFEEFNLRQIDYTPSVESMLHRFKDHTEIRDYLKIASQLIDCNGKKCLFKFTEKKYLNSLIGGEIRLRLASKFNENNDNIAIGDDELNIDFQLLNSRIIAEDGSEIPIKDDLITQSASMDYYISCFSLNINPKLFIIFKADACLIIKNGDVFVQEVKDKYQNYYKNGPILFGRVEYIDPYRRIKSKNRMEFLKSINFEYQNEIRFVAYEYVEKKAEIRKINIDMRKIDYEIVEYSTNDLVLTSL